MHCTARMTALYGLVFASTVVLAGDGFWQTPTITHAGRIHPLPQAAYQPNRTITSKAVFTLTRPSNKPDAVNPALQRVARTVNLYTSAGVALDHLKFVAIAFGSATGIVLDNAHYRQQFGVDNPNLPVISELHKAGVDIAVCGQAVAEHHYSYDWVDQKVTLALSALTTITELQQQGYALVPL